MVHALVTRWLVMFDYKAFGLLELWMWKGGTNLKMSIKWEGVHISHFLGIVPSTHCETSKKIAWQALLTSGESIQNSRWSFVEKALLLCCFQTEMIHILCSCVN